MTAAITALTLRELKRFWRQPTRIIGSLGTPLLIWLFAASGFAGSFADPDQQDSTFGEFLIPGIITMVVLFSTILASISLIQDRHEGFLQSVLVSPVPRWAIILSKVLGGGCVCMLQAGLVIIAIAMTGRLEGTVHLLEALAAAALISAAMIGIGLAAAWYIDSTAGFHGVMNLLFLPMWLLSGALFPPEGASPWLAWVMSVNPLSWATRVLGESLGVHDAASGWHWMGTIGFAVFGVGIATLVIMQPRRSG